MKDCYCAIDIGSSLCHVILGRFLSPEEGGSSSIEIVGTGSSPSRGVKAGSIINIEALSHSLSDAIREAELMSGLSIDEATVSISGAHLQSDNSTGVVAVINKERVVSQADVLRVIEGAQNIRIQNDQSIIHVLSREFSLDKQSGIRDPVGMSGIRLEAEVHIVTAGITALSNLDKSLETSGLGFSSSVMSSLASAEALLQAEEKDLGVALVDIGGGVSDLIIYTGGGVCYSSVIPIGGMHVTQDLSVGLKIPIEAAEFIKKNYAAASVSVVDPTEKIELPNPNGRTPRFALRQTIAEISEARLREILEIIDAELIRSGQKSSLAGGVVLCGGCSLLEGIEELAEEVLGLSVAARSVQNVEGFADRVNSPEFATGVGILHYIQRMGGQKAAKRGLHLSGQQNILARLKSWLVENV